MQPYFFFLLSCLAFTITAQAQVNPQKLDRLFYSLHREGNFNGTVLIAQGENIIYQSHYGYANQEQRRLITKNSVFELASVSKQFTAMGIMILQERGLLYYDDAVDKYLSEFPYPGLTIRHLLNMTSGLPDYIELPGLLPADTIATNQLVFDFYTREKPALLFQPNTRFAYANINYLLLASIIEQVTDTPFAIFLDAVIFSPAGMKQTRSYTTRFTEGESLENYARPYVVVDGQLVPAAENPATPYVITGSALKGDGSIVSTALDLVKWSNSLQNNLFVSSATLAEAYTAPVYTDGTKGEYGFGMYIGKQKVWHWGGWPGVQTSFTRHLDEGTTVIYLKNVETHNWAWLKQFEKLTSK